MLALSRKKNEAIVIYRKEVYLQIQEANKAAVDAEGMAALKNLLG